MDKHENRKGLTAEQKKNLTKKLDESKKLVQSLNDLIEKITNYSGLK